MVFTLELNRLDPLNAPFIKLELLPEIKNLMHQVDISDNVSAHWFDNSYFIIEESPYALS